MPQPENFIIPYPEYGPRKGKCHDCGEDIPMYASYWLGVAPTTWPSACLKSPHLGEVEPEVMACPGCRKCGLRLWFYYTDG